MPLAGFETVADGHERAERASLVPRGARLLHRPSFPAGRGGAAHRLDHRVAGERAWAAGAGARGPSAGADATLQYADSLTPVPLEPGVKRLPRPRHNLSNGATAYPACQQADWRALPAGPTGPATLTGPANFRGRVDPDA